MPADTTAPEECVPVLTQEMADGITRDIDIAFRHAAAAEVSRNLHERERLLFAERAAELESVLAYIKPRLGQPLAEVREEVLVALAEAEQRLAEKAAVAHAAREHLRDLEGYMRITESAREAGQQEGAEQ